MAEPDVGGFAQFLNYGGLGLLAILCLVVLGYNAWSLNGLVVKAEPSRIKAARPLLLAQMALSLVGLLAVGGAGIYLDQIRADDRKERMAQILLDPAWDSGLDEGSRPAIKVGGKGSAERLIQVICTPEKPTVVEVNFERYIAHRIAVSKQAEDVLLPISALSAGN